MSNTLVVTAQVADDIARHANEREEVAGVLLCSVVDIGDDRSRLLGREMHWLDDSAYLERQPYGLTVRSEGYVASLSRSESIGATPVWVHTHPGNHASPRPSSHDAVVDKQISDVFRIRSGSPHYGTLIFSPRGANRFAFTGTIDSGSGRRDIQRLWIVGDRLELVETDTSSQPEVDAALFERNVRALGGPIQSALGKLRIAIVGAGGTGSAVSEQLVRLGVRDMLLIDPDTLSLSNTTRVYGSTPDDVGKSKVHVLAKHISRIAPNTNCEAVVGSITEERVARLLVTRDLVFGCTDDNAGRLILSRVPAYLFLPLIDCGVLLTNTHEGILSGIFGRVTCVMPGDPCLVCRDRIDLSRAAAEQMSPEERDRLHREGYSPALDGVEPAVVPFTTMVASVAISEMLERFIGYGGLPRPTETLIRYHDREMSSNAAVGRAGHYCSTRLGAGLCSPFLDMTWRA